MSNTPRSFAYVEPTIVSLLILSSFIYFLNVARSIAHRLFYAGLIGEILIGIIYAAPLSNILKTEWEQTILDFGYLGLLLLVFEGGLETRLDFLAVKSNIFLSSIIGFTGIVTPIGLSILLCTFGFKFNLLESFTMGASLSATSLGTTFAILSSQGRYQLNKSRMGTILVGAALLDDISGLVIASVIEKLKYLGQQNLAWLISKPIVSSIVMIVFSAVLARLVFGRLWVKLNFKNDIIKRYSDHMLLFGFISTLSATVTIASYTSASTLIGAYCCGAILKHLDDCQVKLNGIENNTILFKHVFEKYIKIIKEYILAPFFFASIGFAVPFLDLWHGQELWQGILYSFIMILGKFITGVWILIWTYASPRSKKLAVNIPSTTPVEISMIERVSTLPSSSSPVLIAHRRPSSSADVTHNEPIETTASLPSPPVRKTKGVYPALIVGLSMVSRGEIGFLIANIGFSTSILSSQAFIVTTWAILLNTILGPIAVGLIVKLLGSKLSDGLWVD